MLRLLALPALAAAARPERAARLESAKRVGQWSDDGAACSPAPRTSGCFDDRFLASYGRNDIAFVHSFAGSCKTCGQKSDYEDCLSCKGGKELVVRGKGCTGMCVDSDDVEFLQAKYGYATLANSNCAASRPCYDDEETLGLAANGYVPPLWGDDNAAAVAVPEGCDDYSSATLKRRSNRSVSLAANECQGFGVSGVFGMATRSFFTASAGA
ncbi:hypothetical protein M885DRAFT_59492 [Pelagophyceae sp. CCMP2097]|nr:hypothetical protein M885DRAFT_59492 [Pelagophyceae sp. CCMP2097]